MTSSLTISRVTLRCACSYPTSLFGASMLSTLYVPFSDIDGDAGADSEPEVVGIRLSAREAVVMRALDTTALHELLLIFVARGRRDSGDAASKSSRQVASLAISDAICELYPRHHPGRRDAEDAAHSSSPVVYHCAIKNPRSLWKQKSQRTAAGHENSDATLSSADHLYVEVTLASAAIRASRAPDAQFLCVSLQYQVSQDLHSNQTSAPDKAAQIQSALDSGCSWRACLAPSETVAPCTGSSRERPLCAWHGLLEVRDWLSGWRTKESGRNLCGS